MQGNKLEECKTLVDICATSWMQYFREATKHFILSSVFKSNNQNIKYVWMGRGRSCMSSDTNSIDDGHGVSRNVLQIHALYTSIPTHMLDERRKRVTLYRYQLTITTTFWIVMVWIVMVWTTITV